MVDVAVGTSLPEVSEGSSHSNRLVDVTPFFASFRNFEETGYDVILIGNPVMYAESEEEANDMIREIKESLRFVYEEMGYRWDETFLNRAVQSVLGKPHFYAVKRGEPLGLLPLPEDTYPIFDPKRITENLEDPIDVFYSAVNKLDTVQNIISFSSLASSANWKMIGSAFDIRYLNGELTEEIVGDYERKYSFNLAYNRDDAPVSMYVDFLSYDDRLVYEVISRLQEVGEVRMSDDKVVEVVRNFSVISGDVANIVKSVVDLIKEYFRALYEMNF